MAKVKLTSARIKAFDCPIGTKQVFLWDTEVKGLAVRATKNVKAFIYQTEFNGKTLRITIGDVGVWSIDEQRGLDNEVLAHGARNEARRLQTIIDKGDDPRELKAQKKAATIDKAAKAQIKGQPALEAWNAYIAARCLKPTEKHRVWSERHANDHRGMVAEGGKIITRGRRIGAPAEQQEGILRQLLTMPLKDITRPHVEKWFNKELTRRPRRATLALTVLGAFFNWCKTHDKYSAEVEGNPCQDLKKRLQAPTEKKDVLQREQLALWFEYVKKINNPVTAAFLQCLLLTGARRNELAKLKWADVDFEWATLNLHDKVDAEGRTIPAPPYVLSLLADLKRRATVKVVDIKGGPVAPVKPSVWVFESEFSASGYLAEPRHPHNQAVSAAGLPHLTIHGLRRSFKTLSEWLECPIGAVAQIMGHKASATAERHYTRREVGLLRVWHNKIEQFILAEAGIEQPKANVGTSPLRAMGGTATIDGTK
jgi:integrase